MTAAPNYKKEPWKHRIVWESHLVRRTRDYHCDVASSVATCECGWAACVKVDSRGAGHVDLDDATHDHWLAAIAEAEAVPA
jgi:hypothetical protein